jgi:alpha-glucosidase
MIDLVPNHTSDQHIWFQESRSSLDNPKRDWYVWRDQPNNWVSISGGSSWKFDDKTGQYYLHSFMESQPDLNWRNPEVREAIKNVMRFWFDKGVDGFRVDAVWALSKSEDYADDPVNPTYDGTPGEYGSFIHASCKNGPHFLEYLQEFTSVAREYDDKHILFEFYADVKLGDVNQQLKIAHDSDTEIAAPLYFEGMHIDWNAEQFGETFEAYLRTVPKEARPTVCFSNHDQPRIISRYGEEQARLIAHMQMTLPGMPVMYYGDEIGMVNVDIPEELTKDKFEKTGDSGGRDPERTPMQWDATDKAGFTTGTPWLPIASSSQDRNITVEEADPYSWINLYKKLLALRNDDVLKRGSFEVIGTDNGFLLVYKRELGEKRYYAVHNFADQTQTVTLPEQAKDILVATKPGDASIQANNQVSLKGYAAALFTA